MPSMIHVLMNEPCDTWYGEFCAQFVQNQQSTYLDNVDDVIVVSLL